MIDFTALALDPAYDIWGVAVTMTLAAGPPAIALTVLDKTAGIEIADGEAGVPTIVPAAVLRVKELTSIGKSRTDLRNAAFSMHGKAWRVTHIRPRPTPGGEADGELLLVLVQT